MSYPPEKNILLLALLSSNLIETNDHGYRYRLLMLRQGCPQMQGMSRSHSAVCLSSVGISAWAGVMTNESWPATNTQEYKSTGIEALYPEEVAM